MQKQLKLAPQRQTPAAATIDEEVREREALRAMIQQRREACEQAPLTARDEAMGQMCIGVHAGVEVPWGPPRFMLLPLEQRQSVTQARRLRAVARRACMHARNPGLLLGPTYTPTCLPTHPRTDRRRPTARPSRWATRKGARRRGHPSRGSCSRRGPRHLVITPPMSPDYHLAHVT